MKNFLGFIILWSITLSAHAAPLRYDLTGQIRMWDSVTGDYTAYEAYTGSLVLSDPTIYNLGPDSSVGDYSVTFGITDFSLTSASFSLTGTGGMTWRYNDYVDSPEVHPEHLTPVWSESGMQVLGSFSWDGQAEPTAGVYAVGDFGSQPSSFGGIQPRSIGCGAGGGLDGGV